MQIDEDPPWLCAAAPRALAVRHETLRAAFHGRWPAYLTALWPIASTGRDRPYAPPSTAGAPHPPLTTLA